MRDFLEVMACLCMPVVIVVAVAITIEHLYLSYQCSNYQEITGVETRMMPLDSCYVKHDGKWMRWDEYLRWVTAQGAVVAEGE